MRWATQRIGIRPFAVLVLGLSPLCAGAIACSSSPSVGNADTGTMTPTPDTGMTTQFDATTGQPDVPSIFGGGDTGTDATISTDAPGQDGGTDATVPHDGGTDATQPPGTDSGSTDSGTPPTDTGTLKDSGGGGCMTVTVPTGTTTTTCPAPVTTTCGPGSLVGYTPSAKTAAPKQNVCTTAQLTSIFAGCLSDTGSDSACTTAAMAAMNCYNCIFTDEGVGAWGPVVTGSNNVANMNIGGCLTLLEPCNSACGAAFENDLQCELKACETNCPFTADAGSQTAYGDCIQTIDNCSPGGCFAYADGTSCSAEVSGAGTVCFENEANFQSQFMTIAPVFCGP